MIKHIKCDIFESGADIICHQVNCQGVMGSGIAKQVRDKYPKVYEGYKQWCENSSPEELLGKSQYVPIIPLRDTVTGNYKQGDLMGIINIFGQLNYGHGGKCYTDYDALHHSFAKINEFCNLFPFKPVLAFPYKFGCARGGGQWEIVYKMIEEAFQDCMVLICEYDGG